jgi:hypothetical protein
LWWGQLQTLGDHTIAVSTSEGVSNTLTFKVLPTGQQDLNGDGNFDVLWNNSSDKRDGDLADERTH